MHGGRKTIYAICQTLEELYPVSEGKYTKLNLEFMYLIEICHSVKSVCGLKPMSLICFEDCRLLGCDTACLLKEQTYQNNVWLPLSG